MNTTERKDEPYWFIEAINDNVNTDNWVIQLDEQANLSFEVTEQMINYAENFTVDMEINTCEPVDVFNSILYKAQQTSLYHYGSKIKSQWMILDPEGKLVQARIQCHKIEENKILPPFQLEVTMVLYQTLELHFDCRKNTGEFYIKSSNFLNTAQIACLNLFIDRLEFKYLEIKTLVQILSIEYIWKVFDRKMKENCLHVVKSDKMIYHFSIKKAKCMHIKRTYNDIWDTVKKNLKVDKLVLSKMRNEFYGNHLYVFLSPFDYQSSLPIFNPAIIIKADKTYNFMTVEIPCDLLLQNDPRRYQFSTIPQKLSDIDVRFVCGKIVDQENAQMDESSSLISPEKDLGLNPKEPLRIDRDYTPASIDQDESNNWTILNQLVTQLVQYYKDNDQLKCVVMLFNKISKSVLVTDQQNKIITINEPRFEINNDFKILQGFQSIFRCTKIEIRNEFKTWIFNITDEETIMIMQYLKDNLGLDHFKNFLMEIDVSVIINLEHKYIAITNERPTKYKVFIEIARQVAKIFEIIKFLEIQNVQKFRYLNHYKTSKWKEFLVFQIPLCGENHLNQNISSVSFIVTFNEKNIQLHQKSDGQSSSSLNVMISPSFSSQSFLLQTLKRDISNIGSILDSLDRSVDTLVEFNEYILGRILYPSIMDGEDKYNVTFVTRSREEVTIYYRDFFALDINFPTDKKTHVFHFNIYDKANSYFYTEKDEYNSNIIQIPNFLEVLKIKIENFLNPDSMQSDSKWIEFRTNNFSAFHVAIKVIFDYLACLYIISKLQENIKVELTANDSLRNPEKFELKFAKLITSIMIEIEFGRLQNNDKIFVKAEEKKQNYSFLNGGKDNSRMDVNLKNCLTVCKVSYLNFRLEIPNSDYTEAGDKDEMKKMYERFFIEKVRHKFYCWKYIRGFIYIFCTPIYMVLKPYELFNIELKQNTHKRITMVRRNETLQNLLDEKCLHIEVLLQTLEIKQFDTMEADVSFTIRYHDKETKGYEDVKLVSERKFSKILLAGKESSNPITEIFEFMTLSLPELKSRISSANQI